MEDAEGGSGGYDKGDFFFFGVIEDGLLGFLTLKGEGVAFFGFFFADGVTKNWRSWRIVMRLSRRPFFLWAMGVWETWLRVREAGALKTLIADGGTMDLPMVRGEAKGDGEKS
jgi:hypothetical protein